MKIAIIFTGGTINKDIVTRVIENYKEADIIGIDGGCAIVDQMGLPLDLMIGDFDSLDETVFNHIKKYAKKCIRLNPIKDQTDTHAAYEYLVEKNYDSVVVLGSSGTRFDHTLANVFVAMKYAHQLDITCIDTHNKTIFISGSCLVEGNKVSPEFNELSNTTRVMNIGDISEYKYISIVPLEKTYILRTEGLKYPLSDYELDPYDTFSISNESEGEIKIYITYGKALIIASKD